MQDQKDGPSVPLDRPAAKYEYVDHYLSSIEIEYMLRQAMDSDDLFDEYQSWTLDENSNNCGYYQVFQFSQIDCNDVRVRYPPWSNELVDDGFTIRSQYASSDSFIRTVHVLLSSNDVQADIMLVCFYRNERCSHFSGVPTTFTKYELREILETKYRPSSTVLPIFLDLLWNNYFYILPGDVFSPSDVDDAGVWTCRVQGADRVSTVMRTRSFPQRPESICIKENRHIHLPVLRKIFWMIDGDKKRYGDIGVQYISFGELDWQELDLPSRRPRMNAKDSEKAKALLSNRTVNQAHAESVIQGQAISKKQLRNMARCCDTVHKGPHGRKPIDNIDRDHAGAFVPSSNVEFVLRKDMTGRVTREIFGIFQDQIMLVLQQATTGTELKTLRGLCEIVENMDERDQQLAFLNEFVLPHQDNSGNLKWSTIVMVDTTFGLTKTHVVTIIIGMTRGFNTVGSIKPRYLPMSVMAHQQQCAEAHRRHMEAFQNVYNDIVNKFPQLKDRYATALITDGEKALKNEYSKLTFCKEAQVLGCGFHKKRNLKSAGLPKEALCKLFGTSKNGILSGALFSALNYTQYQEYLLYFKESSPPKHYAKVLSQAKELFQHFSCISKLRGGIVAQYATTNPIENLNATLKLEFPGPVAAGHVTTRIREVSEDILHDMTDAATIGCSRIVCVRPIQNWAQLSESSRNEALAKRFLKPLIHKELSSLPSLFVTAVGPLSLNSAIRARDNMLYTAYDHGDCVVIRKPASGFVKSEVLVVRIEKKISQGHEEIALLCDEHDCNKKVQFCEHRIKAFLALTLQDRDKVVQSYLNNETHVDHIFRKQMTAKEGHKPCKRTFEPMSYVNRPRKVVQMKDKSFLIEGREAYTSESDEDPDADYEIEADIAHVLNNRPVPVVRDYRLELTDGEDCGDDEYDDPDVSEFADVANQTINPSAQIVSSRNGPSMNKHDGFIERELKLLKESKRIEREQKNEAQNGEKRIPKEAQVEAARILKEAKAEAARKLKEEKAEAARKLKEGRKKNGNVNHCTGDDTFLSRGDTEEFNVRPSSTKFQSKELPKKNDQAKLRHDLERLLADLPSSSNHAIINVLNDAGILPNTGNFDNRQQLTENDSEYEQFLRNLDTSLYNVPGRSVSLRARRPLADITNKDRSQLFDSNFDLLNSNDSAGLFFDSNETGFFEQGPENIKRALNLERKREKQEAERLNGAGNAQIDASTFQGAVSKPSQVNSKGSKSSATLQKSRCGSNKLTDNTGSSEVNGSTLPVSVLQTLSLPKSKGRPKKHTADKDRATLSEQCSDLQKLNVPRTRSKREQQAPIREASRFQFKGAAAIPLAKPRGRPKKEHYVSDGRETVSEKRSDLLEMTVPTTRSRRGLQISDNEKSSNPVEDTVEHQLDTGSSEVNDSTLPVSVLQTLSLPKSRGRPKKHTADKDRATLSEQCSDPQKLNVPRTRSKREQQAPIREASRFQFKGAAAIPLAKPRGRPKKEHYVTDGRETVSEKRSDLLEVNVPTTRSRRGLQISDRKTLIDSEVISEPKSRKRKSTDIFKSPGIQSKNIKLPPKTSTPNETSRNMPDFRKPNSKDLSTTGNSSLNSMEISPVRPSSLDESKDRDRGRSAANWSAISSWVESPPAAPYVFDPRFNDSNESTGDETTFVVPEYIDIPNDSCSYQSETSQD